MDIDGNALLASLFVSSIGMAVFVYGKRQSRLPHMVVGASLMIYPYFVSNVFLIFGIAVVLLGGLWAAARAGLGVE